MLEIETPNSGPIYLRPADITDIRTFYGWRNASWIVSKGRSQRKVSWEEHAEWFTKAVHDPSRLIYVVLIDHIEAGAVFISKTDNVADISLYLLERFTGKGFGVLVIINVCRAVFRDWLKLTAIHAQILHDNDPSKQAFTKAGFEQIGNEDGCAIFGLKRPKANSYIPHNQPLFDEAEVKAAEDAVKSGMWVNGQWTRALESRLSALTGKIAVTVSSGFTALKFALHAIGVKKGDKVIVPAYSCVAIPNSVLSVGGIPVPVDVDLVDFNVSAAAAKTIVDASCKAVIAVNTFGSPADCVSLKGSIGKPVIEDGSHGFVVEDGGWKLGGDIAIMSFYATKLIGSGQGGGIWLESDVMAETIRDLRDYTDKDVSGMRENGFMSDMESAIAYRQLDKFKQYTDRRAEIAEIYASRLGESAHYQISVRNHKSITYRFVLRCFSKELRERLANALTAESITVEEPIDCWLSDEDLERCPNACKAYEGNLSLPLFAALRDDQANRVCSVINRELNKK